MKALKNLNKKSLRNFHRNLQTPSKQLKLSELSAGWYWLLKWKFKCIINLIWENSVLIVFDKINSGEQYKTLDTLKPDTSKFNHIYIFISIWSENTRPKWSVSRRMEENSNFSWWCNFAHMSWNIFKYLLGSPF